MQDFIGKLLIASPNTDRGSHFARSLVYVIKSDLSGSMGVIVNFPFVTLNGSLTVSNGSYNKEDILLNNFHTYYGGPVDIEKGFILQYDKKSADDCIYISSSIEVLKKISTNTAKQNMFLFGYCGWSSGQLEYEVENGEWLLSQANKEIVFNSNNNEKWYKALTYINVNPTTYSSYTGNC